jgi:hypothetical protein
MAFFQLPAPDLSDLSLGGADLHLLECYGFTSDERYMIVRGTFTDAGDSSSGLHYGFWLFDTQTKEYVSNFNSIIAGVDYAREIDVVDVQVSGPSDDLFAVALVEDKGTGDSYLVSIQGDQVTSSNVIQEMSGREIDVKVETMSLSADARFLAIQTSSTQLAPDLAPDTNDSSDIYLLDLVSSNIDRVSYVGGSEVTDPVYLKDIRADGNTLEIAFVTDAAFVSPSKFDINSSEVNSEANRRSDAYVWSSSFDANRLSGNATFNLVSIDQDGYASGYVDKDNEVQITERGTFFTSSSSLINAEDVNSANDVFLSSNDGVITSVTLTDTINLSLGGQFVSASDDGRYASLLSYSSEVSGNTGAQQLITIDQDAGVLEPVSENGELANGWVINGVLSGSGLSAAFTSNADNLSLLDPQTSSGDLYADIADAVILSGVVYHWANHALIGDVELSVENTLNGTLDSVVTNPDVDFDQYSLPALYAGDKTLAASKELTDVDQNFVVNTFDALSALRIAVGLNPNTDGAAVSPYQFIAADVNQDGLVNTFDALQILQMAVGLPGAIPQEWLFVSEGQDFWDEAANDGQGTFTIDKNNVDWEAEGVPFADPQDVNPNFVAVMLGDVDGSWSAPEGSLSLNNDYFVELQEKGLGPAEQWFAFPIP